MRREGRETEVMSTTGTRFLLLSFSLAILFSCCSSLGFHRGGAEEEGSMATLGGFKVSGGTQNSAEIQNLAHFAIDEHNKKENAVLEFARVVEAKEQVVAGTLHHLTLEAIDAGKKKLYEAKVWVKPWLDFKELQEFKHAGDLDDKRDEHEPGLHTAPVHDPVIQDAANHAVKTIQQRSNSLFPYELLEILHAKTEVIENVPKFDLLLKLKRGTKEENYKVEVHKKEGTFHLNQMQLEHAETTSASASE